MPVSEALCSFVERARRELLMVAPFMRAWVIAELLRRCPTDVRIIAVTRWRPEEILQGVSDLEVADVLAARGNARLLLRADLHGKLYEVDGQAIVTSANLTGKALGWTAQPNLELHVVVPASTPEVAEFKQILFAGAVEADEQRRADVQAAVDALKVAGWSPPPASKQATRLRAVEGAESIVDLAHWLPLCHAPNRLYRAYTGDTRVMSGPNFEDAQRDLGALGIPPGLKQGAFAALVASSLSQMPVTKAVDEFVQAGPRHIREMMSLVERFIEPGGPIEDTKGAWDTLKKWLLTFFPDRYHVSLTDEGECFQIARVVGAWSSR